jgi:hypothetical protein
MNIPGIDPLMLRVSLNGCIVGKIYLKRLNVSKSKITRASGNSFIVYKNA